MVLGSHQFSRHANQRTHGSRTHRLGRRHLTCATVPLWHRPIYRQWGIPPRPETAIASVAREGIRASMLRLIYGGGNAPEMRPGQVNAITTFSVHAKVTRLSRQSRETATGTRIPISHDLRPRRPQGCKRRGSGGGTGFLSGTFRRTQRGSAARSAMRSLFACPRTFRKETPSRPRIPGGSSRPCRP